MTSSEGEVDIMDIFIFYLYSSSTLLIYLLSMRSALQLDLGIWIPETPSCAMG